MRPEFTLASAIYKDWYPFDKMFSKTRVVYHPAQLDGAHALVIWGGEDISPSVYNQHAPIGWRSGPDKPSLRDDAEVKLAQEAIKRGIPIIGICRGAQLMCALSGGSLFQHVSHHAGRHHVIQRDDGTEIVSNSLHHQMMNLEGVDHQLIGWVDPKLSQIYVDENGEREGPRVEPEVVWIPKSKALCIQGHPEFMESSNPFVKYALELVEQYCLKLDPRGAATPSLRDGHDNGVPASV